ncbi:unnamed protein product [Didymodactylos carnosus]|uniref:C3H1-type domain-containing protein n=1 Tax=Didymodactylos carnosus TaxID=1234261 RepID=A0A814GEF2_9BILA|nr:unnamed protein product [Didymodactylos carnosus]CAF3767029.1 unnamed protein product [Didymodactylos carnosus]
MSQSPLSQNRPGGYCTTTEHTHLLKYRHVSICKNGLNCNENLKNSEQHCKLFRHCKMACDYGGICIYFHDTNHLKEYEHPFNQPCPFTPYSCKQYIKFLQYNKRNNLDQGTAKIMHEKLKRHYLKYSHVCSWARNCTETKDEHMRNTIHISRIMCSDSDKCNKLLEEDHLNSFSHPNIRDIRLLCDYSTHKCKDRNIKDHSIKYRHRSFEDPLGVAQYFALNRKINFTSNQNEIINRIKSYFNKTKIDIKPDILNWIRSLQPIHRCTQEIFESIIVHGHVMSRSYMNRLRDPKNNSKIDDDINDIDNELNSKEQAINYFFKPKEIDKIRSRTTEMAHASLTNPLGIGYKPDKGLGTNQHVFSVLGPNPGKQKERWKQFHSAKLHCSTEEYKYTAALELMAATGLEKKKLQVELKDIIKRWTTIDSHHIFEAHVPQLILLNYIDHIYMPKNISETLSSQVQQSTKYLFKNSLTITEDVVSLTHGLALKGDFMIILTNDPIETDKTQQNLQCLTCYVAPIPVDHDTDDYHYPDQWSYINNNPPSVHEIVIKQHKFKAGTNLFHQGCNTDDFISYCLKTKRNIGEKIRYRLTSLEYIHVTAGSQIVAFQNVMIKDEQIDEFHNSYIVEYNNSNATSTHDNSENKRPNIFRRVKDFTLGNNDNDNPDKEKHLTAFKDPVLNSNDDSNQKQHFLSCKGFILDNEDDDDSGKGKHFASSKDSVKNNGGSSDHINHFKNECKKALKSMLNVTSGYVFDNPTSSEENLPPLSQQAQEPQIKIRKQRKTKKGDSTNVGEKTSKQSPGLQAIFGASTQNVIISPKENLPSAAAATAITINGDDCLSSTSPPRALTQRQQRALRIISPLPTITTTISSSQQQLSSLTLSPNLTPIGTTTPPSLSSQQQQRLHSQKLQNTH